MADSVFDKETMLDISVNIVPMVIIAFFFVLYVLSSWHKANLLITTTSLGLLIIPFVFLGLLTYFSALVIEEG